MAKAQGGYDLVMLDAFNEDYIPEHMLTREFLQELKAVMTPNGTIVANTFSGTELYDHESTTYKAVFGPLLQPVARQPDYRRAHRRPALHGRGAGQCGGLGAASSSAAGQAQAGAASR